MFGYIKPLKPKLKVKEYEYYRSAYCGLCNSLKTRYGFFSRFIVNYDFTFAALIMSYAKDYEETKKKKRCLVCPSGRNCILSEAYDKAADISVILFYLKLCDDISDNGFWKSLFRARVPRFFLKSAFKRAEKENKKYAERAKELFSELSLLEAAHIPSIDETADKFALMLSEIIDGDGSTERILREILYHTGRFIYITDALDDLSEDVKKGEYNPIAERFGVFSQSLPEDILEEIVITLRHSINAVKCAFDLLSENENTGVLRNIIELGMENSIYTVTKKEN